MLYELRVDGKIIGTVEAADENTARGMGRHEPFNVPYGELTYSAKAIGPEAVPFQGKYLWLLRKPNAPGVTFRIGDTAKPLQVKGDGFHLLAHRFVKAVPIPEALASASLDALSDWYMTNFGV